MAKWTRVRDKRTGHEYSVVNVNEDHHQVLEKDAERRNGKPLPAKPRVKIKAPNMEEMTAAELKQKAAEAGIEGAASMNKQQLVEALKGANR